MDDAKRYDHQAIEKKWQKYWAEQESFRAPDTFDKPKYYVLDMFPYPSGVGLHVGHPEGYTATDIIARYQRMKGFNVLHPMGWDAFGLPAENYAIKTKIHPETSTLSNIKTFKRQIQELGFSYDWSREVSTCLPDYYRWTQWFFAFLYKNGLAYKKNAPVNWCDSCHTVLANEQVVDGKCERCDTQVVLNFLNQWFFKITDFIDDTNHKGRKTDGLLSGLDKIDWPHSTKVAQRNWIGRSEGINYLMKVKDLDITLEAYDSIPQTFMAQTFTIIAPEHPAVPELVKGTSQEKAVLDFVKEVKRLKMTKKFDIATDMQGIFTGRYIANPFGTGDLPIWISSFVVMDYGTGVVNCSAHDDRDFKFAKKYNIPLRAVMFPQDTKEAKRVKNLEYCYVKDPEGILAAPEPFKGRKWGEVREDLIDWLVKEGIAKRQVNYKMRDWLVSRQRYWGAPIPIVYDDLDKHYLVPEDEYPVLLAKDVDFMPTGESPLAKSKAFHDAKDLKRIEKKLQKTGVMPKTRHLVRRESDTMDTFVCSSWYQFRFMDPHNENEFASRQLMQKWGPIDLYVGGAEHTVLHLLYARFFCKALHQSGLIDYDEPFTKLRHQGIILGEDGEKMSKSRGNVINPDDIVREFGADTLRLYEMFMGPFEQMIPWSTQGVQGVYRFLQKTWRVLTQSELKDTAPEHQTLQLMHQTLKKVTHDIDDFKFNTAIAQMMIFVNHLQSLKQVPKTALEMLLISLYPFAPHLAEEAWQLLGHSKPLMQESWPAYDESLTKAATFELVMTINGKPRDKAEVAMDIKEAEAIEKTMASQKIQQYLPGKTVVKTIYVPGKLVNIVIR